jgi:hypothetical protein
MLFVNISALIVTLGIFSFCWSVSKDYYFPEIPKIEFKSYKNFSKGDIICYTNKEHNIELQGLIIDIKNETYLIKWYGFHTQLQNQTCHYINERSKLVSSTFS